MIIYSDSYYFRKMNILASLSNIQLTGLQLLHSRIFIL